MAKEVFDDEQLREKIMAGVDALADTIKATLGPLGRNVVFEEQNGRSLMQTLTNDGATISKGINLADRTVLSLWRNPIHSRRS